MNKVLVFHHYGGIGGAGLSLIHILESIDMVKNKVYVVCPNQPDEMIEVLKKFDNIILIETIKSPQIFSHYNGGSRFFLNPKFFLSLIRLKIDKKITLKIIETIKPDLIITNSMTLFYINKLAKKKRIKNICFNRETYSRGLFGFRTNIIKKGLEAADTLVFISEYDKNKSKSINTKKVVIYDKVDPDKYRTNYFNNKKIELDNLNNKVKVLFLGGISKLKGFHVILNAFSLLDDKRYELIILGGKLSDKSNKKTKRYYYKSTKKLFEKNELINVKFFENTSSPEFFYKNSDIVVFPSTKAHQSRPIYEAGFARKPIIITDFNQTKEFAIDNFNVRTFKKNNYDHLAKIIMELSNSDNKLLIENNYNRSYNNHNLNDLKLEVNTLINELIDKNE